MLPDWSGLTGHPMKSFCGQLSLGQDAGDCLRPRDMRAVARVDFERLDAYALSRGFAHLLGP
jgi:hypothetical protein